MNNLLNKLYYSLLRILEVKDFGYKHKKTFLEMIFKNYIKENNILRNDINSTKFNDLYNFFSG